MLREAEAPLRGLRLRLPDEAELERFELGGEDRTRGEDLWVGRFGAAARLRDPELGRLRSCSREPVPVLGLAFLCGARLRGGGAARLFGAADREETDPEVGRSALLGSARRVVGRRWAGGAAPGDVRSGVSRFTVGRRESVALGRLGGVLTSTRGRVGVLGAADLGFTRSGRWGGAVRTLGLVSNARAPRGCRAGGCRSSGLRSSGGRASGLRILRCPRSPSSGRMSRGLCASVFGPSAGRRSGVPNRGRSDGPCLGSRTSGRDLGAATPGWRAGVPV